jgi:hypothetical protein
MTEWAAGVGEECYDLQNSFGGDGTIEKVERCVVFFPFLLICFSSHWFLGSMPIDWMSDLREAPAILVATRSQGSVVSTHSLDRFT